MEQHALDIGLRLGAALLLGGAIGLERQLRQKSAGLRTHMMVALGSALFMLISIDLPRAVSAPFSDPGRIAAQVITGIGFLGAGTILHSRGSVFGLTTAGSIWLAAAIGMAMGAGLYLSGLIATFLGLLILITSQLLDRALSGNPTRMQRLIATLDSLDRTTVVLETLSDAGFEPSRSRLDTGKDRTEIIIDMRIQLTEQIPLVARVAALDGVRRVRMEG